MPRVLVLGSSNTDLIVHLPHLPARGETVLGGGFLSRPGGKGANQAVAARRAGAEVAFLTAIGDDDLGRRALDVYHRAGIDVTHARVVPGVATGVALIFVGDAGENMIGVAPGANARLTPEDIDRLPDAVFSPGGAFLASLEVPLAVVVRGLVRARGAGMITILNPAPVGPGDIVTDLMTFADVVTPNRAEAFALTGSSLGEGPSQVADELRTLFRVETVIVTLGAEGCLVRTGDVAELIDPFPVEAVDTVGAGDAFNGALAVALAEGRPVVEAAVWAGAAAALAVTRRGAQGGMPSRAEIDRLAARVLEGRGDDGETTRPVAF